MSLVKGPPAPGSRWRHFQGGFHTVICVASRRGTAEPLVIHEVARGKAKVATPLTEWQENVGRGIPRFAPVPPPEPLAR
jgi:hypothetical protein